MGDELGYVRRSRWCFGHGPWRILDGKKAECFVCKSSFPYEGPTAVEGEGARVCKHRILIAYFFIRKGMLWGTCTQCHERFALDGFTDHIRLLDAAEVHQEPEKGRPGYTEVSFWTFLVVVAMAVSISLLRFLFPAATGGFLATAALLFAGCLMVAWLIYSWLRFCRGK